MSLKVKSLCVDAGTSMSESGTPAGAHVYPHVLVTVSRQLKVHPTSRLVCYEANLVAFDDGYRAAPWTA
jgi:hypothetical protein